MDEDGEGGSGVLPKDSLSNTDSRSESWLVRFGGGGRGLLRSVWEMLMSLLDIERMDAAEGESTNGGVCMVGVDDPKEDGSSLSSNLIILPCRELGGGGGRRPEDGAASMLGFLLSSSGSNISCDVRGDSGCGPWIASNIEVRDREDVSVPLLPSAKGYTPCACVPYCVTGVASSEFPVNNSRLKASTSIDALPGLIRLGLDTGGLSRSERSIVSKVFENGFAGALLCLPRASSSSTSDITPSKGSLSLVTGGSRCRANTE